MISTFLGYIHLDGNINKSPSRCKSKPVIICGDFNVAATPLDLARPDSNKHNAGFTPEEREKFSALLAEGFTDTFRHLFPDLQKYSWWSYMFNARKNNVGWRIDYFLISDFAADAITSADIHTDILGSDHCPVSLEINLSKLNQE